VHVIDLLAALHRRQAADFQTSLHRRGADCSGCCVSVRRGERETETSPSTLNDADGRRLTLMGAG
jgi:hypothetical protein